MNGTNLHETGVRQMGRAERGGRGRGETKEEEWLLIKERGGGGDRHRFNVSKGAAVEGWRLGTTSQTFIKK